MRVSDFDPIPAGHGRRAASMRLRLRQRGDGAIMGHLDVASVRALGVTSGEVTPLQFLRSKNNDGVFVIRVSSPTLSTVTMNSNNSFSATSLLSHLGLVVTENTLPLDLPLTVSKLGSDTVLIGEVP